MDKWVLSRLNTLIKTVDSCLEEYKITEAAREMLRFSDDLSNWYVRRCRERFWGSGMTPDKEAAYMTLYTVLETMARLTAPFTPFLAEMIYQNIVRTCDKNAPVSVHLLDFPAYDQSRIDEQAEENMDNVLALCALGRAARNQANIKNRQPLSEILVQGAQLPKMYVNILAEELNVHNVRFVSDASEYISYRVKPQLKTLGPRYGKLLKSISAHLLENSNEIVKTHAEGRNYEFDLEGEHIVLAPVDVLVETERKEGYASASDNGFTVVLATTLTQELIDEGFVRELVSKVQTMRKEADFNVTDRIVIYHMGNERIADIFDRFGKEICADTLADTIITGVMGGYTKEWDVNGETVTLGVKVNE
jgi:isoleucyl-tRNA synthetase